MPVFILRYGDFIHSKAIAKSINFDIQESTWDLNPEGMGAIPLICNVTMDLMLLGGQSLAGPIDKIQTANDSAFIANTSFNSGRYYNNNRFQSVRNIEKEIYGDIVNGSSSNNPTTSQANTSQSTGSGGSNAGGGNAPAGGNQSQAQNAAASAAAGGATPSSKPENRDTNVPKKNKDTSKTQKTTNKNKDDKARKDKKDSNSAEGLKRNPDVKNNLNKSNIPGLTTEEINRVANLPTPSFNFNPNASLQADNTKIYNRIGGTNQIKLKDDSWETYLKNARQKK